MLDTDNKYKVYVFENILNGYRYIGITSMSLKNRVYAHVYESRNMNNHSAFKEALRYYGIDSFKVYVLEDKLTLEEAISKEKFYIKKYRTFIGFNDCQGYNSSLGGEGAHTINDESLFINQYNLDGTLMNTYKSLREAESVTGIFRTTIVKVCDGLAITSGGYQWRRFREYGYFNISKVKSGMDNVVKKVDQFSLDGKWIKTFNSIQDAVNEVGGYSSTIVKVCKGKLRQTRGFMWRYHTTDADIEDIQSHSKCESVKREVYQSNNTGLVAVYESIAEASKVTGFSVQLISHAINNNKLAGGFSWSTNVEYNHKRVVIQLDMNNNAIAEYESVSKASRDCNISRSSIYNCCTGKSNLAGGYKWKYKYT